MTKNKNPLTDDFNSKDLLEKIDANLHQPDKFAKIFCEALNSQKQMDKAIGEVFKEFLEHNAEVRQSVKNLIKEYEKEDRRRIFKKWLGWVGALVLSATSGIIGYFIK